ncbi:MAG: hypothetical protein FD164_2140 [Nitrospirae bacterium]|nr:MAG: hypothetical protein FD164_2140 [Nitrospirota bacterium]HSV27715.1 hypothetical protein [Sedimentisphaerales bacterium]
MNRTVWQKLLFVALAAALGLSSPAGAAQDYPVDGGNSTIPCSGNVLATGKKWGNYPTTITGCILARDTEFVLGSFGVGCKGGSMIEFHPGVFRVKYCTLSRDVPRVLNPAGQIIQCKGGTLITATPDGKVTQCGAQPPPVVITKPPTGGTLPPNPPATGGGGRRPGEPPPVTPPPVTPPAVSGTGASIVVPGESASVTGAGRWTFIGPSSQRPGARGGFLYLGDGGARASYTVNAAEGQYHLWIRFDDDGLHAHGARAIEVWVNGARALAWGNTSQDTKGWVNIRIGEVFLRQGQNSIVFLKPNTTSAAFLMDEFALTPPGKTPL